jgi:hypothetical protein
MSTTVEPSWMPGTPMDGGKAHERADRDAREMLAPCRTEKWR